MIVLPLHLTFILTPLAIAISSISAIGNNYTVKSTACQESCQWTSTETHLELWLYTANNKECVSSNNSYSLLRRHRKFEWKAILSLPTPTQIILCSSFWSVLLSFSTATTIHSLLQNSRSPNFPYASARDTQNPSSEKPHQQTEDPNLQATLAFHHLNPIQMP